MPVTHRLRRGGPRTAVVALAAAAALLPAGPAVAGVGTGPVAAVVATGPEAAGQAGLGPVVDTAPVAAGAAARPHPQLVPLGAAEAWRHSTGDGVIVAVLDSGVAADHPALTGRVLPGSDHVDGSTDGTVDPVGHGTAVASLIAGHDGESAVGLAPDATILPVRVLDEDNRYQSAATVAAGVRWAVEHGADVINLSLGGQGYSAALREALDYAMANDVVVVACTGNRPGDGATTVWYPAREPGVVAVPGLVWTPGGGLGLWEDSVTGPATVLSAPAVVNGAHPDGSYRLAQGTSFASALVTAAAALIRARWPELSAGDVVNRLVTTARDLGPAGRDPAYGFGALDPVAALTADVARVSGNPLDTKARHGTGRLGPAPEPTAPPTGEPEPKSEVALEAEADPEPSTVEPTTAPPTGPPSGDPPSTEAPSQPSDPDLEATPESEGPAPPPETPDTDPMPDPQAASPPVGQLTPVLAPDAGSDQAHSPVSAGVVRWTPA